MDEGIIDQPRVRRPDELPSSKRMRQFACVYRCEWNKQVRSRTVLADTDLPRPFHRSSLSFGLHRITVILTLRPFFQALSYLAMLSTPWAYSEFTIIVGRIYKTAPKYAPSGLSGVSFIEVVITII